MLGAMENKQLSFVGVELMPVRGLYDEKMSCISSIL